MENSPISNYMCAWQLPVGTNGPGKQHVQETLSLPPVTKKTTMKLSGRNTYLAHAAKIPDTELKCAPS